jgi:hypothetical protein
MARGARQTRRERVELKRRLHELEAVLEQRLRDLGGLAAEMHRRNRIDADTLWAQAAQVAAVEDEAALARRGIEERLPGEELENLARNA